jgi:hypothetical protein
VVCAYTVVRLSRSYARSFKSSLASHLFDGDEEFCSTRLFERGLFLYDAILNGLCDELLAADMYDVCGEWSPSVRVEYALLPMYDGR